MIDIASRYASVLREKGSAYTYSGSLRASSMGMCKRQHLFSYFGAPREEPEGKSLIKMNMGTVLGDDIEKSLLQDFKDNYEAPEGIFRLFMTQSELVSAYNGVNVTSHPDIAMVEFNNNTMEMLVYVADIKSTGGFPFKKQSTNPDATHHWKQVVTGIILLKQHVLKAIEHIVFRKTPEIVKAENMAYKHSPEFKFDMKNLDKYSVKYCGEVFYLNTDTAETCVVDVLSRMTIDEVWQEISDLSELVKQGDAPANPPQSWACNYCSYAVLCKYEKKTPKEYERQTV